MFKTNYFSQAIHTFFYVGSTVNDICVKSLFSVVIVSVCCQTAENIFHDFTIYVFVESRLFSQFSDAPPKMTSKVKVAYAKVTFIKGYHIVTKNSRGLNSKVF